jgi:hypothetical protein
MRAVFEIAAIDYGRADVGICGARFQVYEINTNPNITASNRFISDEHRESREIFRARFGAMMHAIDSPEGRAVPVDLGSLDKTLRRRREIARATVAVHRVGAVSWFKRFTHVGRRRAGGGHAF